MRTIALLILLSLAAHSRAADPPFYLGGDISALSDLEKAGAVYRDNGKPGDAIAILRSHGCNLFRLRLFVNPQHDSKRNYGATQDLPIAPRFVQANQKCRRQDLACDPLFRHLGRPPPSNSNPQIGKTFRSTP